MTQKTTIDIDRVLTRGVSSFIDPDGTFRRKLEQKARGEYAGEIVVKFGVDPTRPDIHLGHAVVLRKLRALQDMGCKVIFLVGDFTAGIGDPTGKSKVRPELDQKEIEKNMKTYLDQVDKILLTNEEVFSWIRNSDWFIDVSDISASDKTKVNLTIQENGKKRTVALNANSFIGKAILYENTRMQKKFGIEGVHNVTLRGLLWTLRNITHSQLIGRDMFQDRIKNGEELYMHEMLYPVLQGIDSTILHDIYGSCDLEVGGSDQTFNMLMGRDVMKMNKKEPQAVLAFDLLEGTDGKEKMSKSLDNYIGITDEPQDMFGKVMSVPDELVERYFLLCTYTPVEEIDRLTTLRKEEELHPKELKKRLAHEIVSIYHGEDAARAAESIFEETFREGKFPEDAPVVETVIGEELATILLDAELISSKSEFRRLVDQGAIQEVETNDRIEDYEAKITRSMKLRVGKKRFVSIEVQN